MSTSTINARVLIKSDYAAAWKEKEQVFIPLKGELIVYLSNEEDENHLIKIGTGETLLGDLPFLDAEPISLELIDTICSTN